MAKTWCVGCRHFSNTNKIIEYERKSEPLRLKSSLKLTGELVVFVVEISHKFLLSY